MYSIIIPSYKRKETVVKKTLKCLAKTDCVKDVYIFTASDEETEEYKLEIEKFLLTHKEFKIQIITGVRGIPNQRNFIQRYFPVDKLLVFIDDDISDIRGLNEEGKRRTVKKLHYFITDAFRLTKNLKLKMWGINSTGSNLEMKQTASVGLIYIVGNFYGLINTHEVFVDEGEEIKKRKTYEAGKESHERALKMYTKFGGVIKFRAFGVDSSYWGEKGGHQVSRNNEGEKEASIYLHHKYPNITKLRVYEGHCDLVIRHKTQQFKTKYYQ